MQSLPVPENEDTNVGVALNGLFMDWFLLADTLRPEASDALFELRQMGVDKQLMLTGDRLPAANLVVSQLIIPEVVAQALPATKLEQVQKAVNDGWRPLVVGDGINDALALKAGAVGMAMGANGADIALVSVDVVLTGSDLRRIPSAIRLSHRCRKTLLVDVIIGIGWTIFIVAAAALVAALLHNLSTLMVLVNTGRLLQFDETHL